MDKLMIEVKGVTRSAVEHLRLLIIEGTLEPGQKLNEVELSTRLGVSRSPLREAFRILEGEKLINNIPRRGCYVSRLSIDDCRQIYAVRELIECSAIDHLKEQNIRDVSMLSEALVLTDAQQSIPTDDSKVVELGSRNPFPYFHIKLVESSRNEWLVRYYQTIVPTLARYQYVCYVPEILVKAQDDHKQICLSIEAGDHDAAKQILKTHLAWYVAFLKQTLEAEESKWNPDLLSD